MTITLENYILPKTSTFTTSTWKYNAGTGDNHQQKILSRNWIRKTNPNYLKWLFKKLINKCILNQWNNEIYLTKMEIMMSIWSFKSL